MAWEDVSNPLRKELEKVRKTIGIGRQPDFEKDFDILSKFLEESNTGPFEKLDNLMFSQLCGESSLFASGATWFDADISHGKYLYRIENFASFQNRNKTYFLTHEDDIDAIFLDSSSIKIEDNYNLIVRRFQEKKGWLSLNEIAKRYTSYRNMSWWTNSFDFDKSGSMPILARGEDLTERNLWLVQFAFKVGFATDWFAENILFLRLDSSLISKKSIKVPSIIDAYCQPIFYARDFNDNPKWGLAYDLDEQLEKNYKEFVISDIPANAISLIPVKISLNTLKVKGAKGVINDELVKDLIKKI